MAKLLDRLPYWVKVGGEIANICLSPLLCAIHYYQADSSPVLRIAPLLPETEFYEHSQRDVNTEKGNIRYAAVVTHPRQYKSFA